MGFLVVAGVSPSALVSISESAQEKVGIQNACNLHIKTWSVTAGDIPDAMYHRTTSEIGHLMIFRCLVVVWILKDERTKVKHHGEPGPLMGKMSETS